MSNPEVTALDSVHRRLLHSIHDTGRRRELFSQRPARDHFDEDSKAASDIAAWERQWVEARDKADQKFIEMAMQKPLHERANLFKVRAITTEASARFDANHAEAARALNCAVAEDYAIIACVLSKKAETFMALHEEAKRDAEASRVEAAQSMANVHDRNRNLRNLARQFSVRADQTASPEERARLLAKAQELRSDLPDNPLLGASDMQR